MLFGDRLRVLDYAARSSVSEACRVFGIHRSTFYVHDPRRTPRGADRSGRWSKGSSGNPGGRPKGLARATREPVGEDGMKLAELWWSIASDPMRRRL
jgi:hypothetical protein